MVKYSLIVDKDSEAKMVPLCVSYRLLVTLLCMTSLISCFALQSSMGSTMVCMVVAPSANGSYDNNNNTDTSFSMNGTAGAAKDGKLPEQRYTWDKETQGWIHSSFFIGYYVTQLPSGILSTRYGGRRVAIVGLFVSALAQLLTPLAASIGVVFLCVVRAVCGFAAGFVYAPMFAVLANWVPSAESSLLFGLAGTGMELGAAVSFILSSLVCESEVIGGWPMVYYVTGALGIVTTFVFWCLVSDIPSHNRWMSPRERHYIEHAVSQAGGHGHKDRNDNSPLTTSIPLSAILRSPAVWAIAVAQIGSDWLYYLLITVMPNFMEEVMHMSHTTITLLTGLPLLAIIPSIYVAGSLSDFLRRKNIMSTTAVRKTGDFLCKIFPGAILICLSHLGPGHVVWFVVLYVLACFLLAFIYTSWITNPVDLSPAYTGFITSLSETAAMWIAIVVPILVENITRDKLVSQWQLVFYITGGLQVVTFLFYLAFGSSVLQPWGRPDSAPHGDVITTTENTDKDYQAGGSYVRRKKLRRSLSCPYSSDGEIGRIRTYRVHRSILSDNEEDCTTSWFNGPAKSKPSDVNNFSKAPVYDSVYSTMSSTSASEERHKPMTSDTDASYVTMYGSASAYETAEDEDLYESMDLDRKPVLANGGPRPTAKNAVYENVYENVLVGPANNGSLVANRPVCSELTAASSDSVECTEAKSSIQRNGDVHYSASRPQLK